MTDSRGFAIRMNEMMVEDDWKDIPAMYETDWSGKVLAYVLWLRFERMELLSTKGEPQMSMKSWPSEKPAAKKKKPKPKKKK